MSDHDTDPGAEDTTQPLSLGEVQSPRAPDPLSDPLPPEQLEQPDSPAAEQPEQPEQVASGPTGPPPSTPPPATPATPVGPSWTPPSGPLPAAPSQPWHDYARGTQAFPVAASSHVADRSRPSGWIWPVVVAVALVVGVIGGVGGAIAYQQADDDEPVSSYGGLDDEEIVELPPVDAGGVTAVAEALLPSTVQIAAELDGTPGGATGSGFVIDSSGHIITNNHVIESAASNDGLVEVVDQDGNTYQVEIVGRSPVYDIAVLALPEDADLEPAALGSSEQLRVGDGVVAIGSPLGLSSTVTAGIVSALRRPVTTGSPGDDSSYINAVQTDAAINPGNSGGPLVNLRGQVVGVNSAIATNGGGTIDGEAGNIGVGFAIPVEQVKITADQILETGEARYPVIGAQVGTGGQGVSDGALIDQVNSDTPAEDAGLEAGDLVVEVEGQRVVDGISLIVNIRSHQPGEVLEFTYVRNGKERTTRIELDSEVG